MIIQIAGTNSSGKTYAVRQVLTQARGLNHIYILGRSRAYAIEAQFPKGTVLIGGAYDEVQSSGMDSIQKEGAINYDQIVAWAQQYPFVLFEGIWMMNHTIGIEMYKKLAPNMIVLFLDTPILEVFKSLEERRVANGLPAKGYSSRDIESSITRSKNYASKLHALGCARLRVTRETVVPTILGLINA